MMAFKALALAMNRGVLARELAAGCSLWRFVGCFMLPVIPTDTWAKQRAAPTAGQVLYKLQKAGVKLTAFLAVLLAGMTALYLPQQVGSTAATGPAVPAWVWEYVIKPALFYVSGMALWLEVDGMGDLVDALAFALFNITPDLHFRAVPMSGSLAEFWGRRWNLTVSSILRDLMFHPLCEGTVFPRAPHTAANDPYAPRPPRLAPRPAPAPAEATATAAAAPAGPEEATSKPPAAPPSASAPPSPPATPIKPASSGGRSWFFKMCASGATFAVSGVWHELVFAHLTGGHTTHGVWLCYFVVQAPLITLEFKLDKRMRARGLRMPRWAAIILVNILCAVFITVFWVPPMTWPLTSPCVSPRGMILDSSSTRADGSSDATGGGRISLFLLIMHQVQQAVRRGLQALDGAAGTLRVAAEQRLGQGAASGLLPAAAVKPVLGAVQWVEWLRDEAGDAATSTL